MVALPYVAMALATATSAAGALSASSQANFQSRVAAQNAMIARRNEVDAEARGAVAAGQSNMEGSRGIGQARSQAGGSGIDVTSENVLDSMGTTRLMASFDAETKKNNAAREAAGFATQATNFDTEGAMARARGGYGVVSSILGGAGQVAGLGYSTGLFPKLGRAGG